MFDSIHFWSHPSRNLCVGVGAETKLLTTNSVSQITIALQGYFFFGGLWWFLFFAWLKYPSFLTVSTWWYLHTLFTSYFHYWVRISWRRSLGISLIMHPWWLPWLAEHGQQELDGFCAYEPPRGLVKSRFCFSKSAMEQKICICIKSKLSRWCWCCSNHFA